MQASSDLIGRFVTYIINPIILVVFAAGFFMFMWGLVQFMWALRNGSAPDTGKSHMLWGIVGMVIMVSVEGILGIVDSTFGFNALSGSGPDVSRMENVTAPVNFFGQ